MEGRLLTNLPSKNKNRQSVPLCSSLPITHTGSHMDPGEAAIQPQAYPRIVFKPVEVLNHKQLQRHAMMAPCKNHKHLAMTTRGQTPGRAWRDRRSAQKQALRHCIL